jgi:hypothetical protein
MTQLSMCNSGSLLGWFDINWPFLSGYQKPRSREGRRYSHWNGKLTKLWYRRRMEFRDVNGFPVLPNQTLLQSAFGFPRVLNGRCRSYLGFDGGNDTIYCPRFQLLELTVVIYDRHPMFEAIKPQTAFLDSWLWQNQIDMLIDGYCNRTQNTFVLSRGQSQPDCAIAAIKPCDYMWLTLSKLKDLVIMNSNGHFIEYILC